MSKPKEDRNVYIPFDSVIELLTASEIRMVKQRYVIGNLLKEGLSIRAIAKKIGVGTDTVVRVSKMIIKNPRVARKSQNPQVNKSSKWVFGQVSSKENV